MSPKSELETANDMRATARTTHWDAAPFKLLVHDAPIKRSKRRRRLDYMEIARLFGLPAHPLIVHAVVVLVPLCSLGVAVSALWPAARWRLVWVLLGLTIVTVAMVPLATGSGEVLEEMVKENGLVERHAQLGEDYLPYAFALVVGAVAVAGLQWIEGSWARQERSHGGDWGNVSSRRRAPRWLVIVVAVVALVGSAAATVQMVRVGHSGAAAVWSRL